MTTAGEEPMSVYLDRLRSILGSLEVAGGEGDDEILEQARLAIADVRQVREQLARRGDAPGAIDEPASGSR
jgi:hypothetical protein